MKKLLTILFIIALSGVTIDSFATRDSGKKKPVDSCKLAVTYRVKIAKDTLGKRFYFDNQVLEIGTKLSRYYSAFAEDMDSVLWKFSQTKLSGKKTNDKLAQHEDGISLRKNLADNEDGTYEDIFLNYPSQFSMTVINRFVNTDYAYSDRIESFNWKIGEGVQTVIGYECQKATCNFRGRSWTAWFTVEIPISMGPYKFGGLPGMILKIEDSKKLFIYEAIGVEQPKNKSIYKYDIQAVKATRKDVRKLLDMRWKDPVSLYKSFRVNFAIYDTKTGQHTVLEKPGELQLTYIPTIELE